MELLLVYTKASDNYVLVNTELKKYCIVEVKYKLLTEIEQVLGLKLHEKFNSMKDFKKVYKGYS